MSSSATYYGTTLVERPDSPKWEWTEKIQSVQTFEGTYSACLAGALLKGTAGTGDYAGMAVARCTCQRSKGNAGVLVIEWEWSQGEPPQGGTLPQNEWSITLDKIDQPLAKHPNYITAVTYTEMQAIGLCLENFAEHEADYWTDIFGNEMALELYEKLLRGETHYALWMPVIRLKQYYWALPNDLSSGGFVETPPGLPCAPPAGLEWLRQGDSVTGSTSPPVCVERSWIGAPEWDADIYDHV